MALSTLIQVRVHSLELMAKSGGKVLYLKMLFGHFKCVMLLYSALKLYFL